MCQGFPCTTRWVGFKHVIPRGSVSVAPSLSIPIPIYLWCPAVRTLSISPALLIFSPSHVLCTYLHLSPAIWKPHEGMSCGHIRSGGRRANDGYYVRQSSQLWLKCVQCWCRRLLAVLKLCQVILWWMWRDCILSDPLERTGLFICLFKATFIFLVRLLQSFIKRSIDAPTQSHTKIYNYMTRIWRRGRECPPSKAVAIRMCDCMQLEGLKAFDFDSVCC